MQAGSAMRPVDFGWSIQSAPIGRGWREAQRLRRLAVLAYALPPIFLGPYSTPERAFP